MGYFHGINPMAELAMNGVNYPHCPNYLDQPFFAAGTFTVNAGQTLLNQLIAIDTDADFIWRGIVISTPTLNLRFSDSENNSFSNSFIPALLFSSDFSRPFPIFPEVILPAGGKASFDIQNPTVGNITATIFLVGCKRYLLRG